MYTPPWREDSMPQHNLLFQCPASILDGLAIVQVGRHLTPNILDHCKAVWGQILWGAIVYILEFDSVLFPSVFGWVRALCSILLKPVGFSEGWLSNTNRVLFLSCFRFSFGDQQFMWFDWIYYNKYGCHNRETILITLHWMHGWI